jgi:hypothetical protein
MNQIIVSKNVLKDWIKYIKTFPLYPEDIEKLESILTTSQEVEEIPYVIFKDDFDHSHTDSQFDFMLDNNCKIYKLK